MASNYGWIDLLECPGPKMSYLSSSVHCLCTMYLMCTFRWQHTAATHGSFKYNQPRCPDTNKYLHAGVLLDETHLFRNMHHVSTVSSRIIQLLQDKAGNIQYFSNCQQNLWKAKMYTGLILLTSILSVYKAWCSLFIWATHFHCSARIITNQWLN